MFADFSSREYPDSSAEKLIFRIDGRQNCRDLLAGKRPVKIYSRAISTLRTYVRKHGGYGRYGTWACVLLRFEKRFESAPSFFLIVNYELLDRSKDILSGYIRGNNNTIIFN